MESLSVEWICRMKNFGSFGQVFRNFLEPDNRRFLYSRQIDSMIHSNSLDVWIKATLM